MLAIVAAHGTVLRFGTKRETVGTTVRNVLNSEESRLFSWVAITIDKASSFFL